MEEKKTVTEQPKNEAVPNADEAAKEKPEEKKAADSGSDLDERESKLAEREKALELSERRIKAKELIAERELPPDLIDFVDLTSDEDVSKSVDRLVEIIKRCSSKSPSTGMTAQLGIPHGEASGSRYKDAFLKGFSI
ncbi:MAG: DUF4355 domain-containing protein [Oscillospiraceae bacterium]|nr:DUF4355 domain-containing protein [Oscillospiraceae bacterium]